MNLKELNENFLALRDGAFQKLRVIDSGYARFKLAYDGNVVECAKDLRYLAHRFAGAIENINAMVNKSTKDRKSRLNLYYLGEKVSIAALDVVLASYRTLINASNNSLLQENDVETNLSKLQKLEAEYANKITESFNNFKLGRNELVQKSLESVKNNIIGALNYNYNNLTKQLPTDYSKEGLESYKSLSSKMEDVQQNI